MERTNFICNDIVDALQKQEDKEIELFMKADIGSREYWIHKERAGAFLKAIRIVEKHFSD